MATINRGYTPRTSRLLREYLATVFPKATRIAEFHLTQANPDAIARAGGNVSPRFASTILGYPDAAVITPDEVALWEAKDALTSAAVGQIEGYGMLWPLSVEARDYPNHRVTLHILAARDNPPVRAMAQAKGIEVIIYSPQWFTDSNLRTEAIAAQRGVDAQAAAIVAKVIGGLIPEAAGVQQLEALGVSRVDAESQIAAARQRLAQPAASGVAS